MTDETAARPPAVRAPRFGLSGKLLVLTILFVMIAEVLIYVPLVANFRVNWLRDHLAGAYTAALVLEAAPSGMVPESLAKQILDSIGARAVAMKMGTRRRLLAVGDAPPPVTHDFDMRDVYTFDSIVDAFMTMLDTKNDVMRVVGPAPMGGDFIELVMDEPPLRKAMLRYSVNLLLLSLLVIGIAAAFVYLVLHYLFVRPMRRITGNMVAFRADPENADRIIAPSWSRRRDRHRRAGARHHAGRTRLDAAAEEPARRTWARGVKDQPRSAQPARFGAADFRPFVEPPRSRRATLCTQTDARARTRHRLLPVDALLRPPAGTAARAPADPARAAGRRGSRDARPRARRAGPLDQRGRARPGGGSRLRPALPDPAQPRAQRASGAGEPRRARPRPRSIRITGRREGAVVVIEVSDTGPGFSERARAHLFEAFQG